MQFFLFYCTFGLLMNSKKLESNHPSSHSAWFNPFMYNIVKWPNILQKSCGVNFARFLLKYVWPFYNIMHERVKRQREINPKNRS